MFGLSYHPIFIEVLCSMLLLLTHTSPCSILFLFMEFLKNKTHKIKDRVTRTPLKTGGELGCSGRVISFCSTSDTRPVNLVTNPVISREWGKDQEVLTTCGTYTWSFVIQIFHNVQPSHGGDHKMFEVMASTLPRGTIGSVASLLAATLFQGNPDRITSFGIS
jgi:hypothetical protein